MSPYGGTSVLATALRAGAVATGVVYGSMKLSYLRSKAAANAARAAKEGKKH